MTSKYSVNGMNLRLFLSRRNISPTEAARQIGVSDVTVSKWLDGGGIQSNNAVKLREFLGDEAASVLPDMEFEAVPPQKNTKKLEQKTENSDNTCTEGERSFETPSGRFVKVPLLAEVPMGPLETAYDDDVQHVFTFAPWQLASENLYALIGHGDSMASKIEDGDTLIVDASATPQNGQIVPFKITEANDHDLGEGDPLPLVGVKQYFEFPDRIELRYLNPPEKKLILKKNEKKSLTYRGRSVNLHLQGVVKQILKNA